MSSLLGLQTLVVQGSDVGVMVVSITSCYECSCQSSGTKQIEKDE